MKFKRIIVPAAAGLLLAGTMVCAVGQPDTNIVATTLPASGLGYFNPTNLQPDTNPVVTTPPVYVPNISHANDPLPDGVLAWDENLKSAEVAADQPQAHFVFNFTNVSTENVVILDVHPSCGCTTAELPPRPWTVPPGTNGQIKLTVNLPSYSGLLFKTVTVSTEQGSKTLNLRINILPPVIPKLTEEERAQGIAAAKIDRQAIFRGDCARCHMKNIQNKYGKNLYDAICGICHEAEHRTGIVPDLHRLSTPTNDEFWRTWIAHGKPGSLMPAFATSEGGPLTDLQISTLVSFLRVTIPSQPPANK